LKNVFKSLKLSILHQIFLKEDGLFSLNTVVIAKESNFDD